MLAVVLAGIACGGLVAGAWLRRDSAAYRFAPLVALAGGLAGIGTYVAFTSVLGLATTTYARSTADVLRLSVGLMLPVALFSGVLFPLLGAALRSGGGSATRATGLLTLANTLGAASGSLAAGFLLLPLLGMEASFFLLTVGYGLTALIVARSAAVRGLAKTRTLFAGAALLAAALILFPWGLMKTRYLRIPVERWGKEHDVRVVAVREGRTETAIYLERQRFGEPVEHSLLTDGFAMAGTSAIVRRYMKLFAIWPVAVAPEPKTALLISYGLGSTGRALTGVSSLERIDVVDISSDILEMSSLAFPDPEADPLRDPRVRVHVEDGRHFLQTSSERWDVITGEPPPPKNAGIVSLYTRDYFQLVHDRLTEGGVNTYWLPVHNLLESDAKAIVKAYCEVFTDCSLWRGFLWDWILVGSRSAPWPRSEAAFARLWDDPDARAELVALGLERPEHIGATFIADAAQLAPLVEGVPPLVDDFPKRLSNDLVDASHWASDFLHFGSDPSGRRARFASSEFIRRAWPAALRHRTLERFSDEELLHQALRDAGGSIRWERLHGLLTNSTLQAPVLWSLGTDADEAAAASRARLQGRETEELLRVLGIAALAVRDYGEAATSFERAAARRPRARQLHHLYHYASCLAGRACADGRRPASVDPRFWAWLQRRFSQP
jgi:spermidine synthase